MARTTKDDVIIPQIFTEAVQAAFAQANAFQGSGLATTGAVAINDSFGGDANTVGSEVRVPYFGTLGEFTNNPDGSAVTPAKVSMTSELATVSRDSLAFEVTRWGSRAAGADVYEEGARQIVVAAQRAMDRRVIDACVAAGGLVHSVYDVGSPVKLNYDVMVDAKMLWGDEQDDVVALAVHSKTLADLYKLRDSSGLPILTNPVDGGLPRFLGVPTVVSDRLPLTGSSMGSVSSAGTSPPTVTLSGTPNGPHSIKIIITLGGARGTAKFKFSTDGGQNYSDEFTTAATVALTDTAIDSLVGVNGATGLTAAFATGTYNVDNVYTASSNLKVRSLILKRNALAFWYNRAALVLQTDANILYDSRIAAMHLYGVGHRYRRRAGGTKPGVVVIEHNVS